MKISMRDYPGLVKDLVETAKLEDVFSEEALVKISETMIEDIKDELWDEWDWSEDYNNLSKIALGEVAINRDVYKRVFDNMNVTLKEFKKNYPNYLDFIEIVRKEYNDFVYKVSKGTATVKLEGEI